MMVITMMVMVMMKVLIGITALWLDIQISDRGQSQMLVMMLAIVFCDNVCDVVGDIDRC
jgi:hypothetical protein